MGTQNVAQEMDRPLYQFLCCIPTPHPALGTFRTSNLSEFYIWVRIMLQASKTTTVSHATSPGLEQFAEFQVRCQRSIPIKLVFSDFRLILLQNLTCLFYREV